MSDIVSRDIELIRKGKEYVGNCPFHNEKTGSFFINDEKGFFYCFGCGTSGDIFQYIIKREGITFYQALQKLADLAGVLLPKSKIELQNKNVGIYEVLKFAIEYYKANIDNDRFISYCKSRNIKKSEISRFNIGYAPNNNDLYKYLIEHKCNLSDINNSGLFIQKSNNNFYTRFRNKLMFPIFDSRNRVIAFGGRSLDNSIPKYLNSPETEIFHKHLELFGFNVALHNGLNTECLFLKEVSQKGGSSLDPNLMDSGTRRIRHCRTRRILSGTSGLSTPGTCIKSFIIVEGYIDVLMMHQYGFDTTVGTMGTALSIEHLEKIWKYSDEPIVCLDGDSAGYRGMLRIAHLALGILKPGKSLKFCIMPDNEDPDSYLQCNGKESMQYLLTNTMNLIDFIWKAYAEEFKTIEKIPEMIALWEKNIFEKIENIQNITIKKLYKAEFKSRIYYLQRQTRLLYNPRCNHNITAYTKNDPNLLGLHKKLLLYILFAKPSIIPFVIDDLPYISFTNSETLETKFLTGSFGFGNAGSFGFPSPWDLETKFPKPKVLDINDNYTKIRDSIVESGDISDAIVNYGEIIENIKTQCSRYYQVSDKTDDELITDWKYIYDRIVFIPCEIDELNSVSSECKKETTLESWERLKALKVYLLSKRNRKEN